VEPALIGIPELFVENFWASATLLRFISRERRG
jgi:hypothetical protein